MSLVYRNSPVVVRAFEDVVNIMREGGETPYYFFGHPKEIVNTLSEYTKSRVKASKKYPLIALFQDFEESVISGAVEVSLNIIIANITKPEYKADDRYTYNFEPVLYPIYNKLIPAIRQSRQVEFVDEVHDKIDRLYWGREGLYGSEANIFNDHIDALEINNLSLRIKNNCT